MATIFRRKTKAGKPAKNYSIKYQDQHGRWRTVKGCSTKELTRLKARDLEEAVLHRRAGRVDPFAESKAQPLSDHLQAFRRELQGKGRSAEHIDRTIGRVTMTLAACGFTTVDDLARFDATDRVTRYLADRRASEEKLTCHTSNHYLTALKSFCRWAVKHQRMPASPLMLMGRISAEQDDKRERRAISADDFAKLIVAARAGETTHRLTGEDRAWLYLVASISGLRASELASLTPASFKLEGAPKGAPRIVVRPAYTKNREEAQQPIRADYAEMLAGWLAGKSGLLWPGRWYRRAAEMMRPDLKAARIPYQTDEGFFDFHSLRVTYITNLARAGVHPSIAQRLARHSVITLTMGVYTRLSSAEVAEGLRGLPAPPVMS